MHVTPVRSMRTPRYPTHDLLLTHPELLEHLPRRWQTNPLVLNVLAGALSLVLAAEPSSAQSPRPTASRIAPLFVHGEGRGSFGCIAVNPPVFLSEDEAQQVIREEAQKAGLHFESNALTLKDATVPVTHTFYCGPEQPNSGPSEQKKDLALTGYDKTHNVAFEFISTKEIESWRQKNSHCGSSVSSYRLKDTAQDLIVDLQKHPTHKNSPWVGVFYEPSSTIKGPLVFEELPPSRDKYLAALKTRSEAGKALGTEELRKQVRDFLAWLKAQGVI